MSERISRFEDLVAWQKARSLTASVYRITGGGLFAKDLGLKDQIRRAAVSAMSNIAEGFERGTPSEFHRFLTIAKASCGELRSQLYVALDVGYLTEEIFGTLLAQADEVARIIGGLRISAKRRREA
jgi:four helix bundle protein